MEDRSREPPDPVTFADTPSMEAPKPPPLEPVKKRGRPPGSKTAKPAPEVEQLDTKSVAAGWIGLFWLLRIVMSWFGYDCDVKMLPAEEATQDAKVLVTVPIVHKLRFLSWVGAPIVILQRVSQHFHKRPSKLAPGAQSPAPAPAPTPETPAVLEVIENGEAKA